MPVEYATVRGGCDPSARDSSCACVNSSSARIERVVTRSSHGDAPIVWCDSPMRDRNVLASRSTAGINASAEVTVSLAAASSGPDSAVRCALSTKPPPIGVRLAVRMDSYPPRNSDGSRDAVVEARRGRKRHASECLIDVGARHEADSRRERRAICAAVPSPRARRGCPTPAP